MELTALFNIIMADTTPELEREVLLVDSETEQEDFHSEDRLGLRRHELTDVQFTSVGQNENYSRQLQVSRSCVGDVFSKYCKRVSMQSWFVAEVVALMKLALPIILVFFFQQLSFFVVVLFMGHISDRPTELDAAALANSLVNVTGLSVIIGLSSAADTLCSQSYGFKNYERVGVIIQRGVLILCLSGLLIAVFWLNSEPLLLLLRQEPCVVRLTGRYMQLFVLALPALIVYTILQKYLQCQSVVWIFVITGIIQVSSVVILNALFILVGGMGVIGASIALVISYTISVLFLIIYILVRGLHKRTWSGWSWQSLNEWGPFLKLAIPGFLMICFESWTFEISVIVTGSIDETQLAINAILIQLTAIAFVIPLGVGTAVTVRVGNELGAGNPLKAKRASYTAPFLVVFLLSAKEHIGRVFTSDKRVLDGTAVAVSGAIGVFFSGQIQGTIAGVLRGSGRQLLGAVLNFVLYYIIGLPIGICLALVADMGTLGMWIGLSVADVLQAGTYCLILLTTNWSDLSKKAMVNADEQCRQAERNIDSTAEANEALSISEDPRDSHVEEYEREDVSGGDLPPDLEETPLDPQQLDDTAAVTHTSSRESNIKRERLRLLLTKGSLFIFVFVLLLLGAILAGVFIHSHTVSDCDEGSNNTCSGHCSGAGSIAATFMPAPTRSLKFSAASIGSLCIQ